MSSIKGNELAGIISKRSWRMRCIMIRLDELCMVYYAIKSVEIHFTDINTEGFNKLMISTLIRLCLNNKY